MFVWLTFVANTTEMVSLMSFPSHKENTNIIRPDNNFCVKSRHHLRVQNSTCIQLLYR